MSELLDKLHNDHINFSKLLTFLEAQLSLLEDCESSDYVTMIEAIKYMQSYPDFVHHPLENVVFHYYLEHYDGAREEIRLLLKEHQEMPELTDKLLAILESVLADEPQERKMLCDNLQNYIALQKEHMNNEEANIYPILHSTLNDQDWENIESELLDIEDPLFGQQIEASYQRLRHHI